MADQGVVERKEAVGNYASRRRCINNLAHVEGVTDYSTSK